MHHRSQKNYKYHQLGGNRSKKSRRVSALSDIWNTLSFELKSIITMPLLVYCQYMLHQWTHGQFLGFDIIYLAVTYLFLNSKLGFALTLTIAFDLTLHLTGYRPIGQLFVEIVPVNILLYALKSNFTLSKSNTKFVYISISVVVANIIYFLIMLLDSQIPASTISLFQQQNLMFKIVYICAVVLAIKRLSTFSTGRHEHKW